MPAVVFAVFALSMGDALLIIGDAGVVIYLLFVVSTKKYIPNKYIHIYTYIYIYIYII